MPKIYAAIIVLLLTSCTHPEDLKNIKNTDANNLSNINSFNMALAKGYEQLAQNTAKYGKSWDAKYFKAKAKIAASGVEVLAEDTENWQVPETELPNLMWGAGRLSNVMIDAVKESYPNQLANSQILFDCWMQRASRKMKPEKIEECRMDFVLEMSSLEALLMPVAASFEPEKTGFKGIIYFSLNSDQVDADGMQVIDSAIEVVKDSHNPLKLYGYTDTSGSKNYNTALAKRRANNVAKHFVNRGIQKDSIAIQVPPDNSKDERIVEVIVEQ